jgi:hypothetical protein
MVTVMFNDRDPELARVFAQAREPLADQQFIANLLQKIDHARRVRLWRQILGVVAVAVVVSLNVPPALEQTVAVVRFVGDLSPDYTDLLITPWGWTASMLVGAWVVYRTRPSRR